MDLFNILDGTPEPPIVDLHLAQLNTSGEYHFATPMYEFQKELTDQIVSLHYSDILKYCETDDTTELITKSLEICIENCKLVSTHPYLLIQHYMPKNFSLRDLPAKLAETSGKFHVLKNLINVIIQNTPHPATKNVGIVLKNDPRMFDLTEALLLGCTGPRVIHRYVGGNVKRESGKASKSSGSANSTAIHLIPSDGKLSRNEELLGQASFDALIVMDIHSGMDHDFIESVRVQNRRNSAAVILKLVPMYSIEHCIIHYEKDKNDKSYLYKLISSIVCLRDQIGNLPPDIFPIYNQNLTYMAHTFFDHLFVPNRTSFPAWPLPELPSIPKFSATDVERSLLTEVVYHYTPYDSSDMNGAPVKKRKTYYESKRLQSDYVTNPLRNDFNTISGIHKHSDNKHVGDTSILTHLLVSQLNVRYLELALVKEEFECYKEFKSPKRQNMVGRRIGEVESTLASIMEDVDHAEQRLQITDKKILKRTQENEEYNEGLDKLKEKLNQYSESVDENSLKGQFIRNQLSIWQLQKEVTESASILKSKNDEKSYLETEVANCESSAKQSEEQIASIENNIAELERKLTAALAQHEAERKDFAGQRLRLKGKIELATSENDAAKAKLAKTLKYLRETSHLKKRKGRGSPSV